MVCSWRGTYTYQGLWETFDRKLEEYTMQYMKYQLVKKVKDEWAKARSEFTRDMSVIDDMRSKVQMEAMQDSIFQTLVGTQVSDWKLIDVHAYDLYRHPVEEFCYLFFDVVGGGDFVKRIKGNIKASVETRLNTYLEEWPQRAAKSLDDKLNATFTSQLKKLEEVIETFWRQIQMYECVILQI